MPLGTTSSHAPNRSRSSSNSSSSFILISDGDSDVDLSIASDDDVGSIMSLENSQPGDSSDDEDVGAPSGVPGLVDHDFQPYTESDEDRLEVASTTTTDHGFEKLSIRSFSMDDSDAGDVLSVGSSEDFDMDPNSFAPVSFAHLPQSPSVPPLDLPSSPPPLEDPLPTTSSSSETTSRRRRNRGNSHAVVDPTPFNTPHHVTSKIFSYLDHRTLYSTLTVSKGWFQCAATQVYRDPFNSLGRDNDPTRPPLTPSRERLLVQLLLRSIKCPSEPGEQIVLVCEEFDDMVGACRLVDKFGLQIHVSTNYMRFLEVFDWAPWNRYMNYWEASESKLYEISEGWEAAFQAAREGEMEDDQGDHSLVQEMLRAAMYHKRAASPFRVSYNTLLDWFVENPRAHTVIMHPDMVFSEYVARRLPQWTTLRFAKTSLEPCTTDYQRFEPMALLQALFEHEIQDEETYPPTPRRGIRHLQLPSSIYYDGVNEQMEDIRTMLQVIQRPLSLDVSALSNWSMLCLDFPSDKWEHLVRLVSLEPQTEPEALVDFICRRSKLRELEMVVKSSKDVNFGKACQSHYSTSWTRLTPPPLEIVRLYSRSATELHHILEAMIMAFNTSLRELKVAMDPADESIHHYLSPVGSWPHYIRATAISSQTFMMPNLVELHLDITSDFRLHGANPFEGCPRLQRLSLRCLKEDVEYLFPMAPDYVCRPLATELWKVPSTIRELTLSGYEVQNMFNMECLADLELLESLTLLDQAMRAPRDSTGARTRTSPQLAWRPRKPLTSLKTLKLSGFAAELFSFHWLPYFPALDELDVDGLEYDNVLCALRTSTEQPGLHWNPMNPATGYKGPKICRFTIRGTPCLVETSSHGGWSSNQGFTSSYPQSYASQWGYSSHNYGLSAGRHTGPPPPPSPPVNDNLLSVLRLYCPHIRQLTISLDKCGCTTPGSPSRHVVELEWGTLAYLKQSLPSLIRFRTDSISLDVGRLSLLREYGFVRRVDSATKDLRLGGCTYWIGELDFVLAARR